MNYVLAVRKIQNRRMLIVSIRIGNIVDTLYYRRILSDRTVWMVCCGSVGGGWTSDTSDPFYGAAETSYSWLQDLILGGAWVGGKFPLCPPHRSTTVRQRHRNIIWKYYFYLIVVTAM